MFTILLYLVYFTSTIFSINREEFISDSEFHSKLDVEAYRTRVIRDEFSQSWDKYRKVAMGADEIGPMDGKMINNTWNGWGVTLVDSLDTLWLMGLKKEFKEAVEVVSHSDYKRGAQKLSFFEITIRYLGGLISAYDLSGEKILLDKAKDLADAMLNDFSSPSGLPYVTFDFRTGKPVKDTFASLANVGTCQLEFTRLSLITGDNKYRQIANNVYDVLDRKKKDRGLYNMEVNVETGDYSTNAFGLGGGADSFFEYLIKLYIMLGPQDKVRNKYLRMFDDSMVKMKEKLLTTCYKGHQCLGHTGNDNKLIPEMHHLEFFIPGMLLLGNDHLPDKGLKKIALDLLETYSIIPELSETNLAPENTKFSNLEIEFINPANFLRPELSESLYYAYLYTGDKKYQDRSWNLFLAFQKFSKSKFGFTEYKDVNSREKSENQENVMQSFFYAETFKYLYLIQAPKNTLNLNDWVFNTEAHPFKISKSS
ncbi:seven-hairpin glycosidase [Neoconidiobolus thromboides FSU 785]|nr:seven-hairpin glycosidase [Neoconidiobolus thromboides FSU 785]